MSDSKFLAWSLDDHAPVFTPKAGALWRDATILSAFKNLLVRDDGQDLIEYALLAAFIALAAVVAITQLGTAINNIYTRISSTLSTAGS